MDFMSTGPLRQMNVYDRPIPAALPSGMIMEWPGESNGLAALGYALWKRRWTVLIVTAALTAIVTVISLKMAPVYEAVARIEVEPETPQAATDTYQKTDVDEAFIQTQIQVLSGPTVVWKTIEQTGLVPSLGVLPPSRQTPQDIERNKVQLIKSFQKHLNVQLLPKTHMLTVTFSDSDPQRSSRVTTALVNTYLEDNFQQKYESIRRSGWLDQQLSELKGKVETSQQDLINYESEHEISTTGDKENVVTQMLGDLGRNLTTTQSERIQKESQYAQVLSNRGQMAALASDDLLQKLEGRLADLKEQYTATVSQYGPNFPRATRLQLQIAEEQGQVVQEQNRVIERMRSDYNAARDREKLALSAVAGKKEELAKLNQLMVQDNLLRREFETNEQLYQSLLGRVKDASISAGLRSTSIHLVDAAMAPTRPVRPQPTLYGAIAFLAGIVLGGMAAFAQDKMDSSIRTAEEAEALIATPALGGIPLEREALGPRVFSRKNGHYPPALALTKKPNSSLSEAFRALGTAVSGPADPPKTLLVTSAQNGEGKTVTTINLGQALAQRNGPVLIMDCDLRCGSIARTLGLPNNKGVSTVLSGEHDVSEALQQYGPQAGLWVLTSGAVPLCPAELLASQKMASLLEKMSSRFNCVIIDSPPVLPVTDATILSTRADRVLLVAASGSTSRAGLLRTRRVLAQAGARVLGVAINKVDPKSQNYSGYYSYSHVA